REAVARAFSLVRLPGQLRERCAKGPDMPRATGVTGAIEVTEQVGQAGIVEPRGNRVDTAGSRAPERRRPGEQMRSGRVGVVGLAGRAKGGAFLGELGRRPRRGRLEVPRRGRFGARGSR